MTNKGSTGPDGEPLDGRGLFLTQDPVVAKNYADDQAGWRKGRRKPVVVEADDSVIGKHLIPVDTPHGGEMLLPTSNFDKIPDGTFTRNPPGTGDELPPWMK